MGDDAEVKMLVENLNKKFREKFSQFKEDNTKKWKVYFSASASYDIDCCFFHFKGDLHGFA